MYCVMGVGVAYSSCASEPSNAPLLGDFRPLFAVDTNVSSTTPYGWEGSLRLYPIRGSDVLAGLVFKEGALLCSCSPGAIAFLEKFQRSSPVVTVVLRLA